MSKKLKNISDEVNVIKKGFGKFGSLSTVVGDL